MVEFNKPKTISISEPNLLAILKVSSKILDKARKITVFKTTLLCAFHLKITPVVIINWLMPVALRLNLVHHWLLYVSCDLLVLLEQWITLKYTRIIDPYGEEQNGYKNSQNGRINPIKSANPATTTLTITLSLDRYSFFIYISTFPLVITYE